MASDVVWIVKLRRGCPPASGFPSLLVETVLGMWQLSRNSDRPSNLLFIEQELERFKCRTLVPGRIREGGEARETFCRYCPTRHPRTAPPPPTDPVVLLPVVDTASSNEHRKRNVVNPFQRETFCWAILELFRRSNLQHFKILQAGWVRFRSDCRFH